MNWSAKSGSGRIELGRTQVQPYPVAARAASAARLGFFTSGLRPAGSPLLPVSNPSPAPPPPRHGEAHRRPDMEEPALLQRHQGA
jgi:hypothetical protein